MHTPFDHEHADAWSTDFADVESLNAGVSSALIQCVNDVRKSAESGPERLRTHSVLVLGPAGAGKTHLFARLRRHLGARASFVLLRPEIGVDPTPGSVLAHCVDALQRRVANRRERQVDIVIGSALAEITGDCRNWPNVLLDQYRELSATDREARLSAAMDAIEDAYPEVATAWLETFFRLPFAGSADRRAALTWLSGREPSAPHLERLGRSEKLPEISIVPALRTLSVLASYSAPIVLVFDQLENLVDGEHTGRIRAHGQLLSELFDAVGGLVIVQMALDAEWQERIRPALAASQRSRLEARTEMLALPTSAEREALVQAWGRQMADGHPHPLPWPFDEAAWENWRKSPGVTPRALMIAAREAYLGAESGASQIAPTADEKTEEQSERMAQLWTQMLSRARAVIDEAAREGRGVDAEHMVSGLGVALRLVEAGEVLRAPAKEGHDLRVVGPSGECDVFVVQKLHHRSVGAALRQALVASRDRRVIAVRERALAPPPTWRKVGEHLHAIESAPGIRYLELSREDVARLLAVHELMASARSRDLSARDGRPIPEADVRAWARASLEAKSWLAVAASLGEAENPARDGEAENPARDDAIPTRPSAPTDSAKTASTTLPVPDWTPTKAPPASGLATQVLAKLRVASVDRLVREVRARVPDATRKTVLADLRDAKAQVRWLGRSIVALSEEAW